MICLAGKPKRHGRIVLAVIVLATAGVVTVNWEAISIVFYVQVARTVEVVEPPSSASGARLGDQVGAPSQALQLLYSEDLFSAWRQATPTVQRRAYFYRGHYRRRWDWLPLPGTRFTFEEASAHDFVARKLLLLVDECLHVQKQTGRIPASWSEWTPYYDNLMTRHGKWHGYQYDLTSTDADSFSIAVVATDAAGGRSFYVDQTRVIRFADSGPAGPNSAVLKADWLDQ